MPEHLTPREIGRFLRGKLPHGEAALLLRHAGSCRECADRLQTTLRRQLPVSEEPAGNAAQKAQEEAVLGKHTDGREISRFTRGELTPAEGAALLRHAWRCRRCGRKLGAKLQLILE